MINALGHVGTKTQNKERMMFELTKVPHVTYSFTVVIDGEKFQPCRLLATLLKIKRGDTDLWDIAQNKIDALNHALILDNAVRRRVPQMGPNIDKYINDLKVMIDQDEDLKRLWNKNYAGN